MKWSGLKPGASSNAFRMIGSASVTFLLIAKNHAQAKMRFCVMAATSVDRFLKRQFSLFFMPQTQLSQTHRMVSLIKVRKFGSGAFGNERGCLPGSFFDRRSVPFRYALTARSGILDSRAETEGLVTRELSVGFSGWNDGPLKMILRA